MRIAICISPNDCVPPKSTRILAPWVLAKHLVDGLVARGHDVTLYCAEGSDTTAKQVTLGITPFFENKKNMAPGPYYRYSAFQEQRLTATMLREAAAGAYDVVHIYHGTLRLLPLLSLVPTPVICTIHDPFSDDQRWMYSACKQSDKVKFLAISESHKRQAAGEVPIFDVCYNGLSTEHIPVSTEPSDELLMLGRLKPEKGFHTGIAAAKQAGKKLVISGEYFEDQPAAYQYWLNDVKPHVDDHSVDFVGFQAGADLWKLYGQSKALLFPIGWEEAFGMVMIESMACGTPVIAYNRGSVPEIIQDGVTGFIIDPDDVDRPSKGNWIIKKQGIEGIVEAIGRIGEIDRKTCRQHVEDHFTTAKMIDGYERAYQKLAALR